MSFRKISLAVLCIALLQNAMAQRWVSIAPSSEAGAAVFIDAESISQSDEYLKAWFKYSFSTQQAGVRDTTFRSYLELLIVDCKKNIQATRSVVFYPDAEPNGQAINRHDFKTLNFQEPPSGTMGARQVQVVCRSAASKH